MRSASGDEQRFIGAEAPRWPVDPMPWYSGQGRIETVTSQQVSREVTRTRTLSLAATDGAWLSLARARTDVRAGLDLRAC